MSTEPIQTILTAFELSLLLAGGFLLFRLVFLPEQRTRWLKSNRLSPWPVSLQEFGVFIVLVLATGFFLQAGTQVWLGGALARSPDRAGMELVAYGLGFHGGALLGWLLFRSMRKSWQVGLVDGPPPPPPPTPVVLPWPKVFLYAAGGLLAVLPAIFLINLGWVFVVRKLGLPDDPQDSIAIFANAKSPVVVAGMFVVACVLAPLNEELFFRAGLYRFCRQRLGRGWGLLLSGTLFGAVHLNWAGSVPLAAFGVGLAVVYEATGSIRVAVVAHGLFNLMNITFIILGGQPP